MFTFFIENDESFGPLTKNCPTLDKNKSIVSSFFVFVVYKSAVSTVQKSNYVGCFSVCICTSVSRYFNKISQISFSGLEKNFSNDFALFHKMTAEVSRNNGTTGFIRICTSQSI